MNHREPSDEINSRLAELGDRIVAMFSCAALVVLVVLIATGTL
jgi:hypothetical protein